MTDLRWGLIGCGDISQKRAAPALRDSPGSTLAAVNRKRTQLAQAFANEFGASRVHVDWCDLVTDPGIDAVYVATPLEPHAEQTIAAAEAGKHVLCEKPMAMDVESCDRMIAAAKANGVQLGVAYYRRFYPVRLRMAELITSGTLGIPLQASVQAFERFDTEPGELTPWRLLMAEAGGGPMMDFGSHRLELLVSLFGDVESVTGWSDKLLFPEREVEDSAGASLKFKSGVRASLLISHAAVEPRDVMDVYLSEGSLHVDELNTGELRIVTRHGTTMESLPPHANLHQPLVEDFVDAIHEGRTPRVTGEDGREVQRLLTEVYSA
jgi:predicted dehydrogenase